MNFPGPINSSLLSSASAVSLDSEHFNFTAHPHTGAGHDAAGGIIIPDKHLLFEGAYTRDGNDLVLSAENQKYVVHDYFKGEKRPSLLSEDGAMLSGHIVSSLTGYTQYAQAAPADVAQVIGHVMKLTGSASVIRNGVTVELNIGDAVQKGDVIQTGSDSSVALTLIDGSAFGMTANARMVLSEMVYDPNGSSNSSFISLVQGTITFVAGQTAKNGNMRVETPVATMGIRGTAVLVKIDAVIGDVAVSLGVEPDGHVGGLVFYDNNTGALVGTMSQAGRFTLFSPAGVGQQVTAAEYLKSPDQVLSDKGLFNQVFQLYFPNFNPDSNPKSTDHPRTDIGIPPTVLGKTGTDPDTGRPTITYTIQSTNPDTHVTTDVKVIYINTPASFFVVNVNDVQATLGAHQFKLGDQVTITDPDIGVAPFFDVAVPYVATSGSLFSAVGPATINFGSFLLNSHLVSFDPDTGVVTYDPAAFRFLDDNETAVYTFNFNATSGPDTGHLTLLLTVTGENDAPTIVGTATTATGGVTEDSSSGNLSTTGTITYQDFDLTDAHTVTVNGHPAPAGIATTFTPASTSISTPLPGFDTNTASLGTFKVTFTPEDLTDTNDTGTVGWTFELNDNDTTLQSLAEGQKITQTYTVTVTDNNGVPVDQIVTITITGTNDQPIINADTAVTPHIADEVPDTTNSTTLLDNVSGSLIFSDVDLIDTHQASAALDTSPTSIQWSTAGGIRTDIPGATLAALATAMTASIATGQTSGTPGVTDPDSTDTGSGSLDWKFSLPDNLSDFLAHGETLTVVYDITVTDNSGTGTATSQVQKVTVQISAANDQPVIAVIAPGAVKEDDSPSTLTYQGAVNFTDVDETDTHTVQATFSGAIASGASGVSSDLAAALQHALGVPSTTLTTGVHTFNWNFALDNSLVQYLGEGETITATYTIGVTDNSSASDAAAQTQTVTVVITGTNDMPTITVANPTADTEGNTGTPDPVTVIVADHVTITDVDTDDVHTPYVAGTLAFDAADSTGAAPAGGSLADLFTVNAANGTVTYDKAAFDYLAAGEIVTATFNFDASSGPDTQHQSIVVTINGENDAPVVTNAALATSGSVTEDTTLTATGQLSASDVDDGATQAWGIVDTVHGDVVTSLTGAYGSLAIDQTTGKWTYTLDNSSSAVQSLAQGEHHDETFTVRVTDDQGAYVDQAVTVTVNGTDDAPTISVANPLAVTEGNAGTPDPVTLVVADHVTITDVDTSDVHTPYVANTLTFDAADSTGPAPVGHSLADLFTVDATNGTVTYDKAAFDYLSGTDTVTATFTFDASSGPDTLHKSIAVTIDGTNDAPVLNADNVSPQEIGDGGVTHPDRTTQVFGITLADVDETGNMTVTAVADHGTMTDSGGHSLASVSETLADIQDVLANGVIYTPTEVSPDGVDHVTLTVTDSGSLSDTLTFVFNQQGSAAEALTGTAGKDIIFASGNGDTLTGLGGQDNFVFAPHSGAASTVSDFTSGQDKIVLNGFDASSIPSNNAAFTTWLTSHATGTVNAVIDLNNASDPGPHETITLTGVAAANLHANDFIIHPGSTSV